MLRKIALQISSISTWPIVKPRTDCALHNVATNHKTNRGEPLVSDKPEPEVPLLLFNQEGSNTALEFLSALLSVAAKLHHRNGITRMRIP